MAVANVSTSLKTEITNQNAESLAALLPEEVLSMIFEEAGESALRLESYDPDYPQLYSHTLVCRRWLQPARCALWKTVHLGNAAQNALFLNCVTADGHALGTHVRSLDTRRRYKEANHTEIMKSLLDVMPHLTAIAVGSDQLKHLHKHPVWQRIEVLRMSATHKQDLLFSQEFPPRLRSLILSDDTSLVDARYGQSLAQLRLPNLQTLVFQEPSVTRWGSAAPLVKSAFLPKASRLSRLVLELPRLTPRLFMNNSLIAIVDIGLQREALMSILAEVRLALH